VEGLLPKILAFIYIYFFETKEERTSIARRIKIHTTRPRTAAGKEKKKKKTH
jgi:hypothetical protein